MKYSSAMPPTLPTWEAFRTEPMPSTMVQKMIGPIIILIRLTNAVPMTARPAASLPKISPTAVPATTATMTAMYSQCVLTFFRFGALSMASSESGGGDFVVDIDSPHGCDAGCDIRIPSQSGAARPPGTTFRTDPVISSVEMRDHVRRMLER